MFNVSIGACKIITPHTNSYYRSNLRKHFQMEFQIILFIYSILAVLCAVVWTFLYCYFATHATDRLTKIGNNIYESSWYEFPINIQKYLILIIIRSQNPIYFTGLGLLNCTLESFGKVSQNVLNLD